MEFEPIFPAGFHDISIDEFEGIFVSSFVNQQRRIYLKERFFAFMDSFRELGINAEIWIDGSFSTQKEEPNDVDMVIFPDIDQVNALSPQKKQEYRILTSNTTAKIRFKCDVSVCDNGDPERRVYWKGMFGYSKEDKPKGIPRITHVANRKNQTSD